ncbi:MAG: putative bifunctional diguanylate cyclase/phosphodiesterase, partial [Gammaproteobacteria bacterium]
GELRWVEGFMRLARDDRGQILGTSGTLSDINERKASEARIQQLAYHDTLTGLPNRALLLDRLDQALAEVERHERTLAVLYLDLDRFKLINDSLGHHVGDLLLTAATARMRGLLRAEDTLARQGGDEFVVVLPDVQTAHDPAQVAEKIISALAVPFDLAEHRLQITTSIGISVYPTDGRDRDALLRHADAALYQAKEQSRNTYRFFDAEINRQANQRLAIENGLRVAQERGELILHYQPLFDLRTLAQTGVEALLRWRHPERGLVPSAEFIAVAEGSGLIVPIGRWVLSSACQQAAAWRRQGLSCARIAVNLSARQLRHDALVAEIREALTKSGLDPADLDLEITESSLMHDTLRAGQVLEEIDALGVQLTMDDFGTGYSSLSYLKRFPLDRIKIDRTFVRDVPNDPDDVATVHAIVAMAHQLRLCVVAEGVETPEQLAFLKDCGCDEIQGYLLGPPLPAEHFSAVGGLVTEPA